MTLFLLDTDVVSNLRKPKPHPRLVAWMTGDQGDIRIPLPVIFEVQSGIERLRRDKDAARADEIETWLERLLAASMPDGIVCPDVDDARLQTKMFGFPALRNFLVPDPDSKKLKFGCDITIAAMAIVRQAVIVSFDGGYMAIHEHFALPGLFDPGRGEWLIGAPAAECQPGEC